MRVTVRVPATSANLGPGFDCLGLALDVWNTVSIQPSDVLEVHVVGQGADRTPKDERNLVVQAAKLAFQSLGVDMPSLRFECTNAIPFGAGMGSSSAAIIAGVVAAFAYLDHVPDELHEEVLQVAVKLEGHVDNIAPCLYGGLRIGWQAEDGWRTSPVSVPDNIRCVLFVPDAPLELSTGPETKTQSVRAILSPSVSRHDAVYNIARSALLVNAFASNQLHLLKHAMQDTLHQPARGAVMPVLFPAIESALEAGACGACLSGAGPSVLAIVQPSPEQSCEEAVNTVTSALLSVAEALGVSGRVITTPVSTVGAAVIERIPTVAYVSTRDVNRTPLNFCAVAMEGLAKDGGLFVPTQIPRLDASTLLGWCHLPFPELAHRIMRLFVGLDEVSDSDLRRILASSYSTFRSKDVVPLVKMEGTDNTYLLEQFHGPTCAFKDVALQFVGNLFEYLLTRDGGRVTVVGATSGDTGSAAIEGLRGKENVRVFILHPKGRVAAIQEAQMTTVLDANVHNIAVDGTFDDCQTIVKELFSDASFRGKHCLAAINSINFARILAQIVYYFHAYNQWVTGFGGTFGEAVTFCVPSGNFGNAMAGYYAKQMGLPIHRIIVATNRNDILHRFISNGDFTKHSVEPSLAPAMDITVPSNFERFLFHHSGDNAAWVTSAMAVAKDTPGFTMGATSRVDIRRMDVSDPSFLPRVRDIFVSACASDTDITAVIDSVHSSTGYTVCPHTAAGVYAVNTVGKSAGPIITMATAHPGKFRASLDAIASPVVPECLKGLLDRPRRCVDLPNDVKAVQAFIDAQPV